MHRFAALGFAAIALLGARSAHAEPNAFLARVIPEVPFRAGLTLVRGVAPGARELVPGISVVAGDPLAYARAHPEVDVELHPPLLLKLDVSAPFIGVAAPRAAGLDGTGTYVGVVDTGADITHRAFRRPDGTTRIAWFLDMMGTARPGNKDDEQYGGRVWSAAELNGLLAGTTIDNAPTDNDGHGTHVAGIAAGSGGPDEKYLGIAPGAELVIVRAIGKDGGIAEPAAILGAKFVFDRATAAGKPAVVNLSLGTQYGAHDGTSAFEQGLTALAAGRGRAVVVAASNEGALPIHTSVRVTPGAKYRIPIRLLGADGRGAPYSNGQVYVWINARDRGELRVGLRGPGGDAWLDPVAKGGMFQSKPAPNLTVTVGNEKQEVLKTRDTSGAVVWLTGALPVGVFELELEGDTATEIWLQGSAQAIDGPGMPLFVRGGQIEGSIGVPASAPGLISVGSVSARTFYEQRGGTKLTIEDAVIGTRSYFSSAGPSANGVLRPDILAPGHFVISALARSAFLAVPDGQFSEDQVIDANHGALAGTSMSSPFAAGAIALMFQKAPSLTQEDVRALLQAGARPLADDPKEGGSPRDYANGAGILDLEGALAALDRKGAPPRASSLFMRLGASYLAADGGKPLQALLLARDGAGRPADVEGGLSLALSGARVQSALEHPAVGLYRFSVVAEPGLGGKRATVGVRGGLSLSRDVPIAADKWDARDGIHAGGGCSMAASESTPPVFALALLTIPGILRARSRARARAARRGGTG